MEVHLFFTWVYIYMHVFIYFLIHICSIFNVNTMLWQIVTIVMPIKHILHCNIGLCAI